MKNILSILKSNALWTVVLGVVVAGVAAKVLRGFFAESKPDSLGATIHSYLP